MITANRKLAIALGGALCIAAVSNLHAGEPREPKTVKPLAAVSLDAGSKHVIGYFLSREGACKLTLMVAETADGPLAPSRLQVSIDGGKNARFDAADGKALLFTCKPGAQAMSAAAIDRLAAYWTEE